jgi:hypothetical protein
MKGQLHKLTNKWRRQDKRKYLKLTRACIIKLITSVIYSFRNKLEPLSLNTRLGRKGLPETNTLVYYRNRNLQL